MPEIQIPNEPNCEFCNVLCENGGNSIKPIFSFSNDFDEDFDEEQRCCDDCNVKYVIPTRLQLQKKDNNFCHRCCCITNEWIPVFCIYCRTLTGFCDYCIDKVDGFGTFSKFDENNDCGYSDVEDVALYNRVFASEESSDEANDDENVAIYISLSTSD
jgi:hypothetical protein